MNHKKITKTALSGLVAVTMIPAFVAPLTAYAQDKTDQSTPVANKETTAVTESEESNAPVETEETVNPTGDISDATENKEDTDSTESETPSTLDETEVLNDKVGDAELPAVNHYVFFDDYLGTKIKVWEGTINDWKELDSQVPDGYAIRFTIFGKDSMEEFGFPAYYIFIVKEDGLHSYNVENPDVTPLNITFIDAATGETIKKSTCDTWNEYEGYVVYWHTNDGPGSDYFKEQGVYNILHSIWKLENGGITVHVKKAASSETTEPKEEHQTDSKDASNNSQKEDAQNVSAKKESKKSSKGVNTAVFTPFAGIFGMMGTALAGMIALLRRKQK